MLIWLLTRKIRLKEEIELIFSPPFFVKMQHIDQ